MKKSPKPTTVTTSTTSSTIEGVGVVACTFEIDPDQPEKLVQLFPAGYFKSSADGRPSEVPGGHWYIDGEVAEKVIAQRQSLANDLLFDYEHQTLETENNGKPAPASGWGKNTNLIWNQSGLFVQDVQWTESARTAIRQREYRYISPVFSYNKETGHVLRLLHVALTNSPAIDGMDDVITSLNAKVNQSSHQPDTNQPTEPSMNEELRWLLTLLGINVDTDIDAAALRQQLLTDNTKIHLAALKATVTEHGALKTQNSTLQTEVAALKARTGQDIDLTQYVPATVHTAVIEKLAALTAKNEGDSVASLIKAAQDDGKLIVQEEIPYLESLGSQNLVALKANLEARQSIAALRGSRQTGGKKPPEDRNTGGQGVAALTAEQVSIANQFGYAHDKFAEQLNKGGV